MDDSEVDQQAPQQSDSSERLFEELVKVISASYDKASAYTNLVMVAGYATFFATWASIVILSYGLIYGLFVSYSEFPH
jgi:hypothetical protein